MTTTATQAPAPTEKQVALIQKLGGSVIEGMTRKQASFLIDGLIRESKEMQKPENPFLSIPAGRYVLEALDGTLGFFQVDQPKEGTKWFGWTFVKRLFGSPQDYRKVPLRGKDARDALQAIALDPKAAMARYGKESGICGNCASPLTDPDSLARGLGPICAANLGWKE
jgi:hypothetical protein